MTNRLHATAFAALIAAFAASCVDVARDRARRDLTVGQAEHGDDRVSVHEGLAAVRRLAPGELRLWAGAPRLLIHFPVGARNGAFASRGEANKLLSLLAQGGVDLTFYGHIHSYYAYENAGIPAYITGGGGAIPERLDGMGRHFLTVDVSPFESGAHVAVVRVD